MTTALAGAFDFLSGEWRIAHRRLLPGANEWDIFDGEATCWSILCGAGSVEELRIPARDFSGVGLRLLDRERGLWTDYWANGRNGVLTLPAQVGGFENGVGTFHAEHKDGDQLIRVRGTWDQVTPVSCRWRQAVSGDNGATWAENWLMEWRRA